MVSTQGPGIFLQGLAVYDRLGNLEKGEISYKKLGWRPCGRAITAFMSHAFLWERVVYVSSGDSQVWDALLLQSQCICTVDQ